MLAAAVARERATLPRLHVAGGSRPLAPGYEYTGGMSVPMLSALLPTEMKPAGGLTGGEPAAYGFLSPPAIWRRVRHWTSSPFAT